MGEGSRSSILNKNRLRIFKCCASCQYKEYKNICFGKKSNRRTVRMCNKHGIEIEGSDICDDYEIADGVMNEGKRR